jgi:nitric oxide reductase NorD protein
MSWDEKLFHFFHQKLKSLRVDPQLQLRLKNAADFHQYREHWSTFASLVAERKIRIRPSENRGGWSQESLFLPEKSFLFSNQEENQKWILWKILIFLEYQKKFPLLDNYSLQQRNSLIEENYPEVESRVLESWPSLQEWWAQIQQSEDLQKHPEYLWGDWYPSLQEDQVGNSQVPKSGLHRTEGTEIQAPVRDQVRVIELPEDKIHENPLVHSFEKVHTAEEYKGGVKNLDGSDQMLDQQDALEELDMREVIRTTEAAESLFKAELSFLTEHADIASIDSEATKYHYDEWDYKTRTYKKDWCSVFEESIQSFLQREGTDSPFRHTLSRAKIEKLKHDFFAMTNERRWRDRQKEGPEVDVDALVDNYAFLKAKTQPLENMYRQNLTTDRSVATMILVDSSLSTDSWVADQRVLDVSKQALHILSEVLGQVKDPVAMAGFYSCTHNDCRFLMLKKFDQSWDSVGSKIQGLKPTGYTRMGPALRHALWHIQKVPSRKKLILVLSDGKPTDFDRYEGFYGMEDVRQAVQEAHQKGVFVRCLAIEKQGKFYLPKMFGYGRYHILSHPELLPEYLLNIYRDLVGN